MFRESDLCLDGKKGLVKAALEASVRYIAYELGPYVDGGYHIMG